MNLNKITKVTCILSSTAMFAACTQQQPVFYNPQDFVNPNRVVTKKIPVPLPKPAINASFGYANNPAVVKAYEQYSKSGKAQTIKGKGFKTLAFDGYAHPIIACEPLHLCVVQLERGETINNIDLGDSAHWLVSTSLIGTKQDGSYQVVIKPKQTNIATDMVIATNKRTYNVGLVSKEGHYTHVVNFYYPEETLNHAVEAAQMTAYTEKSHAPIVSKTHIDVNQLNFDYALHGDKPAWLPERIFDDGNKTFIQMPATASHYDLPVLYILRDNKEQLVNYRYQRPYYVLDSIFNTAYLISGKGKNTVKVIIDNHHVS